MSEEKVPINLWVNEERFEKLRKAGLEGLCEDMLAGLKVLRVYAGAAQKERILKAFPTAKFDSATTGSIELLPREAKDRIFELVVEKGRVDVIDDFLESLG